LEEQLDEKRVGSEGRSAARKGAIAYQGAMESVLSILVGAGLGYWLDSTLTTTPLFLLLGLAAGFGAFILRMMRLGRRLGEVPEDHGDEK
jgi:F0F1-type ATP synthase assembly protein I